MLLRLITPFNSMTEMVRQQERIANNLANAGTVGYRRDRSFTEALQEKLDSESNPVSERVTQQWTEQDQGPLEATGNPLDVALKGDGWFTVTDPVAGADRYTRAGRFVADREGNLRTAAGLLVQGEKGPVKLPKGASNIEITGQGEIVADGQRVERLKIARIQDPSTMRRLDGSLFEAPGVTPTAATGAEVLQGYVEGSNVNPIKEMSDMIVHFRTFESQQKMISSQDAVLGQIVRDLGRF